jgi:hypothetical protein
VANPDPWKARLALAARRKPGDIAEVRAKLWGGIVVAYDRIGVTEDSDKQRQWVNTLAMACTAYAKLCEASEVEARLSALEKIMEETRGQR